MSSILASVLAATAVLIGIAIIGAAMVGWMALIATGHVIIAAVIAVAILWLLMVYKFEEEARRGL